MLETKKSVSLWTSLATWETCLSMQTRSAIYWKLCTYMLCYVIVILCYVVAYCAVIMLWYVMFVHVMLLQCCVMVCYYMLRNVNDMLCSTWHDMSCYVMLCCVRFCCYVLLLLGYYAVLCYGMIWHVMTWYAVLCYAMLCCAMLCYAMLYYVMQCHAMTCHAMLCCAMLCYALLCYSVLCYVMLCCVMICYVIVWYVMLCYVRLYYVMICYVMMCCVMLCSCCFMLCLSLDTTTNKNKHWQTKWEHVVSVILEASVCMYFCSKQPHANTRTITFTSLIENWWFCLMKLETFLKCERGARPRHVSVYEHRRMPVSVDKCRRTRAQTHTITHAKRQPVRKYLQTRSSNAH